jgi:exodeoxyribonuclease V alpha subunit
VVRARGHWRVLAGLVERVTYHNAQNGFCVLRTRARGHRDVVTVVGHAAAISATAIRWMTNREKLA